MAALPKRWTDPPPRPSLAGITTAEGLIEETTAAAPFKDAEIHILDSTLTLPTPGDLLRGMVGNPVTGALIAQRDADERQVVERALLRAFEGRSGGPDRPFTLSAECHVLIARRV